jgi:hypothetical protein
MCGAIPLLPLYAFILCTGTALRVMKFFLFVGKKMAETESEQVISLVKACILSMKGGVPVKSLNCKLYVHLGHHSFTYHVRREHSDFYCLA